MRFRVIGKDGYRSVLMGKKDAEFLAALNNSSYKGTTVKVIEEFN